MSHMRELESSDTLCVDMTFRRVDDSLSTEALLELLLKYIDNRPGSWQLESLRNPNQSWFNMDLSLDGFIALNAAGAHIEVNAILDWHTCRMIKVTDFPSLYEKIVWKK